MAGANIDGGKCDDTSVKIDSAEGMFRKVRERSRVLTIRELLTDPHGDPTVDPTVGRGAVGAHEAEA